jgi:hypothetical protein
MTHLTELDVKWLLMVIQTLSGWWLTYPSEKYEKVSWDDDIPNIWKHIIHVPNHQPVMNILRYPDLKGQPPNGLGIGFFLSQFKTHLSMHGSPCSPVPKRSPLVTFRSRLLVKNVHAFGVKPGRMTQGKNHQWIVSSNFWGKRRHYRIESETTSGTVNQTSL